MGQIKLVIWDWNGTLLDDTLLSFAIANELRSERGMEPIASVAAYRELFRFPIIEYYRAMGYSFETEPFEHVAVCYHAKFESRVGDCPLYAETVEALELLKNRGIPQILLSVTEQWRLDKQVAEHGVGSYFCEVCGQRDELGTGKADMAAQLLQKSGLLPDEVLFVGDTDHDAAIAKSLGCRGALLTKGHQPRRILEQSGFPLIDSLTEIENLL